MAGLRWSLKSNRSRWRFQDLPPSPVILVSNEANPTEVLAGRWRELAYNVRNENPESLAPGE